MIKVSSRKGGGAFSGTVMLGIALLLMLGGVIGGPSIGLTTLAQIVVSGFGAVLFVIGGIILIISKLYVRASSNTSFVRTGMGGQKSIINGGGLVIPVIHEIIEVSHETMKLEVQREGKDALITGDKIRGDLTAEFYISVPKTPESVTTAAASLGDRATDPDRIKKLMMEKLVDALRAVAGQKKLNEIHTDRQGFADEVNKIVAPQIEANGLKLETVTISKFDQTPTRDMVSDDNVFDAEGARAVAEIVAAQKVQRNKAERDAELKVTEQDVETRKAVLDKNLEREEAEAENRRKIAEAQAIADNAAAVKASEEAAKAEAAEVNRQRTVEVAEAERQSAVKVAEEKAAQAQREAEIAKDKAVEIAERDAKIAIEERETARAEAEAKRQAAEALAEEARQQVRTVEAVKTAERDKETAIINEAAEYEKNAARDRIQADVLAYKAEKEAEGERLAAEKRAEAIRTRAAADKDAEVAKAEGAKANQMVSVEVEAERVRVEEQRVAVRRKELENENEFAAIAAELKVRLASIDAGKEVDIARAKAMGDALGKAEMQFWGDPETFKKMSGAFLNGQATSKHLEGLVNTMPEALKSVAAGLVEKFTGQKATDAEALALAKQFMNGKTPEDIAKILSKIAASQSDGDDVDSEESAE